MRRDRELVVLHDQIADRYVGEVERERFPLRAVIVRDVHAVLRGRVQQPLARGIFADRVHPVVRTDPVDDLRPRLTIVGRLEQIRRLVIHQRATHGDIRDASIERRGVNLRDTSEIGHPLGRDVRPRLAAVLGHMHEPVVRAGPDDIDILLARPNREDHAVDFGAVHVARDRTARGPHGVGVMAREVAADRRPVLPTVTRLPEALRRHEKQLRVELREDDRVGPLPALFDLSAGLA